MPRTMRFLASVFLTTALGCSPQTPVATASATPSGGAVGRPDASAQSDATARTRMLATEVGALCEGAGATMTCVAGDVDHGDYFELTFHVDCEPSDFSVRVKAPTEMRNRIAPLDTATVARALPADRLCVRATGSIRQHPEYYYVTRQAPAERCAASDPPSPRGSRCLKGWIDAESVDIASEP